MFSFNPKFEYKIVPVPSKKDIYTLSITKKGWLQLAGFTALAVVANVAMYALIEMADTPPKYSYHPFEPDTEDLPPQE